MANPLATRKLDLVNTALRTAASHASLLRHAIDDDDVDGMTRYREGLRNALELVNEEMSEIERLLPDWRPVPEHRAQADGCDHANPDAHLGASEA